MSWYVIRLTMPYPCAGGQDFHKVPVEKMFTFHQPRTDYSIHPQITTSSDTEDSSSGIVSDQPRSHPGAGFKTESIATSEQSLHGSIQSVQSSGGIVMYELYHCYMYIVHLYVLLRVKWMVTHV